MIEQPSGIFLLPLSPYFAFLAAAAFAATVAVALVLRLSPKGQLAGLFGVGAAVRLFVATRNPLILQDWPLNDDSHYYFTIARNLAHGHGLRHDSFHTTTGFQPLYLLVITPFELIPDKLLAINCILVFQAALGVLCGVLLYRLARLISTPGLATFAAGVWATSLIFVTADLNGLETNTSLAMLLATLLYYFRWFRGADPPGASTHATLGLLCGTAFLARVDLGFLIPILGIDLLWRYRAHLVSGSQLSRLATFGGAALLPMLPWLVFNLLLAGSILPSSGQAVRFISQAYGYGVLDPSGAPRRYFEIGQIPFDYYQLTAVKAFRELSGVLELTFPKSLALVIIAVAVALEFRRVTEQLRRLTVVFAFLAVLFSAYTFYIFGQWYLGRYLTPFAVGYLCALLLALTTLGSRFEKVSEGKRRLLQAASASAVLGMLLYPTLQTVSSTLRSSETTPLYQMSQWLNANTPSDAVIGTYQSGIMGYYLDRQFHGLDGKINVDALHAMQAKKMDRYVREVGIDYLTDVDWMLDDLYVRLSEEPDALSRHQRLASNLYQMTERKGPAEVP